MAQTRSSSSAPLRIAVSGYYGCGNAGDEAVLAGIRDSFQQRAGDTVHLTVFSQDPAQTQQMHRLAAVDRMSLSALRTTLKESDLLLSGGGSLLQDTTSLRSLLYYLFVIRLAYSRRLPFMFYAQGIGPLRRALSRRLVRLAANHAVSITVRDPGSADLLARIGVPRPKIEVTADPAFALEPAAADTIDVLLAKEGLADTPFLGVSLRPWGASPPLDAYARLLQELEQQCGLPVALIPMHAGEDVAFAEQVAAQTGRTLPIVRDSYPPDVLLGLVGRARAIVAMRLHTLIFAARMGVPPIGLAYDPKVQHLMLGLDLADSLTDWRDFDPVEIAGRLAEQLRHRELRISALQVHAQERKQAALRNAECALEILTERPYAGSIKDPTGRTAP